MFVHFDLRAYFLCDTTYFLDEHFLLGLSNGFPNNKIDPIEKILINFVQNLIICQTIKGLATNHNVSSFIIQQFNNTIQKIFLIFSELSNFNNLCLWRIQNHFLLTELSLVCIEVIKKSDLNIFLVYLSLY